MKKCTILFIVSGLLTFSLPALAQGLKELSPGYYLVISAYAKSRENVAQNYVEVLRLKGTRAGYGFNSSKNLHYVYLEYFTDLKTALREMSKVRSSGAYKDAWVRVVPGEIVNQAQLQDPIKNDRPDTVRESAAIQKEKVIEPVVIAHDQNDTIKVTDNPEIKQYDHMTLGNTEVFLSLYNGRNNRIVDGEVQVIDTERSRLMTKVKGNEYLILPDPKSKSGELTLVCEAFGYRKVQETINYPLPLADTVKPHIDLMGTTIVINFDMVRYHRGDIAVLYNVYFYNDASIMLPDSKFELNSLLQMMQEDPKYKIRLHGHTNGNYQGKIISLGENKNFFSLEGSKQGIGTAKDLSYNRADIIKQYLIANGIDGNRIEIKAWGGKRPLYDKHSVNAKKNVRVEVEILED